VRKLTEEAKSTLGTFIMQNGLVLGEMFEPSTPGQSADVKDTSAQNNIGGVKTKLVSWIDNDNLAFKLKYTGSTAQNTLLGNIYDRTFYTWTIVMPPSFGPAPGGISFNFQGQIAKSKLVADGDGPAVIEMEVTVNGRFSDPVTTWAAGLTTTFFTIIDDDTPPNALTPVPAAAAAVYEYDIEAYSDNTSVIITPTATAGTIYVNGTIVATGVPSGSIPLNTGTGAVTYVSIVKTEINKTPKIYWLRFALGNTAHP
jgi:voltage-gated potassium channel Kch